MNALLCPRVPIHYLEHYTLVSVPITSSKLLLYKSLKASMPPYLVECVSFQSNLAS